MSESEPFAAPGPYNFDKVHAVLKDWISTAVACGRLDIKNGDVVFVGIDAERGPERLKVWMNVDDRPVLKRTPRDLKKRLIEASPRIAADGMTGVGIEYEAPRDPASAAARLLEFMRPHAVFAGVAGALCGRDHTDMLPDLIEEMALALHSIIEHADIAHKDGYPEPCTRAIAAAVRQHYPSSSSGDIMAAVLSALMAPAARRVLGSSPFVDLLAFLCAAADGLGAEMVKQFFVDPDAAIGELGMTYCSSYMTRVYPEPPRGGFVAKLRIWTADRLILHVDVDGTEDIPAAAAAELRAGRKPAWSTPWSRDAEADEIFTRQRLRELRNARGDRKQFLFEIGSTIDGRDIREASEDAIARHLAAIDGALSAQASGDKAATHTGGQAIN
jgi:hypothetical protein